MRQISKKVFQSLKKIIIEIIIEFKKTIIGSKRSKSR